MLYISAVLDSTHAPDLCRCTACASDLRTGSQFSTFLTGWYSEAVVGRRQFVHDIAIVELYAAAQGVAALADSIRRGSIQPEMRAMNADLRRSLPTLDLHSISHSAYVLAFASPSSDLAITARESYGPIVSAFTMSKRLRQRCRKPRVRHRTSKKRLSTSRRKRRG